jgi:hypothetical protein
MALSWLYFMSGVLSLFAIIISIFLTVFFPNNPYISNVLPNLLGTLNQLGDNGLVGLISLIILVGQYFLAYNLYNFFKQYKDKT